MTFTLSSLRARMFAGVGLLALSTTALLGQDNPIHGRKYRPPPPLAHIVITVEKSFNSKPLVNAAVVFHSTKDGKDNGNLEVKTDPEGKATMDLIEAGSHVTMQVIANGYATHAEEFDANLDDRIILVKMERPRAQVSGYAENDGKPSTQQPGVQEHERTVPATANPPVTAPGGSGDPATTSSPTATGSPK